MRIVSVINQKGGVGKTTTVLNLGAALALGGHRTLLIDLDPQSHLTDALGLHAYEGDGADAVLLDGAPLEEQVLAVRDRLGLVPAGGRLGLFEGEGGGVQTGMRLRRALERLGGDYAFVLIDCPPSAGMLAMNALMAARELMIPVASDYLSLHGLARLLPVTEQVERRLGLSFERYLVLTRFQSRRRLAREVKLRLFDHYPDRLMPTAIRENVSLAESPSFGQTIFEYKKRSHGAADYLALAGNLLRREVCARPAAACQA